MEQLDEMRQEALERTENEQAKQKAAFDKKRKPPRNYQEGDLVLIRKNELPTSTSRKLAKPYSGPMKVKKVLPNDRYVVCDLQNSHRTAKRARYEKIVAVDRMKPWLCQDGISDETNSESGEDGVVLSSESDDEATPRRGGLQDGRM